MIKIVKCNNLTEYLNGFCTLWEACFPEDASFAKVFLENAAPFCEVWAAYDEKTPVSMAFLIPATICAGGERYSARYVYGVGTLPTYRSQGLAVQVLQTAIENTKADCLYLHPATPSLEAFYERLCFSNAWYQHREKVITTGNKSAQMITEDALDIQVYTRRREEYLQDKPFVYADIQPRVLQVLAGGYRLVTTLDEYALLSESDGEVLVIEYGTNGDQLLDTLCQRYAPEAITVVQPLVKEAALMVLPLTAKGKRMLELYSNIPFYGPLFDV